MASKLYKIIFFILGIGTLAYMVYALGINEIWTNIQKTGWWFGPVLISWLIIYLMNAFAFRDIINEKDKPETKLPFGKVFQLTVTGYALRFICSIVHHDAYFIPPHILGCISRAYPLVCSHESYSNNGMCTHYCNGFNIGLVVC